MTAKDFIQRLDFILGESASDWCGCVEGDLADRFNIQKLAVSAGILELVTDYMSELGINEDQIGKE